MLETVFPDREFCLASLMLQMATDQRRTRYLGHLRLSLKQNSSLVMLSEPLFPLPLMFDHGGGRIVGFILRIVEGLYD
jgi:hypothetical protein